MAGHSRSKNGVASLAYVPAIHVLRMSHQEGRGRNRSGHDGCEVVALCVPLAERQHMQAEAAADDPKQQHGFER
jgi:hypothetical protein